jgi:hypothetical protein
VFRNSGNFENLGVGTYIINVQDQNNCTTSASHSIVALYPRLEIHTTVSHVSCFGGNDGSITAMVTGGSGPFQYQWQPIAANAPVITNLLPGEYRLAVADTKGCTITTTTSITGPQRALNMTLATTPVCYDRTNGTISATASGGTPPYQYSSNGLIFQTDAQLALGAGNYEVHVVDANGCSTTSSAVVETRNNRPHPNFLIATSRNTSDTLTLVDISTPKPDSIHWKFDPSLVIVNPNSSNPTLKLGQPGNYDVTMTGYFEGCYYSVTKQLNVDPYDPLTENEKLPGYKPIQTLTASPNPTNGILTVQVGLSKAYRLTLDIFNTLGSRLYSKQWAAVNGVSERIDLTSAPTGVYLLRVVTDSDAREMRFVINK